MIRGNYAEALVWAARSLASNPNFDPTYWVLIAANAHLGRMDEAHRFLGKSEEELSGHDDCEHQSGTACERSIPPRCDPRRAEARRTGRGLVMRLPKGRDFAAWLGHSSAKGLDTCRGAFADHEQPAERAARWLACVCYRLLSGSAFHAGRLRECAPTADVSVGLQIAMPLAGPATLGPRRGAPQPSAPVADICDPRAGRAASHPETRN